MNQRLILTILLPLLSNSSFADGIEKTKEFETVGARRIDIIDDKIEAIGCILDKNAILKAKDGEVVLLKHKDDHRGDVKVIFNHVVLPEGNWILYRAKNSLLGTSCEEPRKGAPNKMEAVSAVLWGRGINRTPRSRALTDEGQHRSVYVRVDRLSGWDIKVAHSRNWRAATHSFSYDLPRAGKEHQNKFEKGKIPIVNMLYKNDDGELLAGGLYWFSLHSEQDGADQSATALESKSEGKEKSQPESEERPQ